MNEYPLSVRYVLDDEWMGTLCAMAGYGIDYWASEARHAVPCDAGNGIQTSGIYTVRWENSTKTVAYGAIARAVQRILTDPGEVRVSELVAASVHAAVLDVGDIDADVADVVIQVAVLGRVIYG